MQRNVAFRVMPFKEIAGILQVVGVHPAVSAEQLEKPTPEIAAAIYQTLAEFAFDMDLPAVKARANEIPGVHPFVEIFDEGMDMVTIYKMIKQLASINRIEDFSLKDIWDPQSKRLRMILSGLINFARYKETQSAIIQEMKDGVAVLEHDRAELANKSSIISAELTEAHAQHSAELEPMWLAENEMREAQGIVDRLNKQKQTADKVQETAEAKLNAAKERLQTNEARAKLLRENIADLQEQVAESPEGLEQELQELKAAMKLQKAKLAEKQDEQSARKQKVQVLTRLNSNLNSYKEALDRAEQSAAAKDAACEASRAAQNELTDLRSTLEACKTEEMNVGLANEKLQLERTELEQALETQIQEFQQRREQATAQHQELQEKRTEEQKQWSELQATKQGLQQEINNVARNHDCAMEDLHNELSMIQDEGRRYVEMIDGMTSQSEPESSLQGGYLGRRPFNTSPGSGRRTSKSPSGSRRGSFSHSPGLKGMASPAPQRLANRFGY